MFARRILARSQFSAVARQLRPRAAAPLPVRAAAAPVSVRSYATQQPSMEELERLMQADPKLRDMMEKLSRRPSALVAMQEVGRIVQSKGFEAGKMPSRMDMMKLMMDKEFRDAAQKLNEEMKEAGVEFNPEALSKMMGSQ